MIAISRSLGWIAFLLLLVGCSQTIALSSAEDALKHDDATSFARLVQQEGGLGFVQKSGYTWLHKASKFNAVKCTEYLIQNKADLNAKTEVGLTPMHTAITYGSKDVYLLLKKSGADTTILTDGGQSVADYLKSFHPEW